MKNNLPKKYKKYLFELLKIESISAQAEHKGDMKKACMLLTNLLGRIDFDAKIMKTDGHPVVYGEKIIDKKFPTILIYGHYDVQSPDPLDKWKSDPFKPVIRNGNVYARGVADDKGQLLTWISAIEDITKRSVLNVNLKFLLEGEEEVGSRNLEKFIIKNKKLLKCDIVVISDSHSLSPQKPLIDYGLRGLTYMEVTVSTLSHDVHSGLYGGNVINPAIVLAQLISSMKNANNKIAIPGFYDNVRKLNDKEKKLLSKSPFSKSDVIKETGALVVDGEKGFNVPERAGARPTIDVNGIVSGYTGEGPKTIIPAFAKAKISMRLVPNQNSKDISKKFTKFVKSKTPRGVKIDVQMISEGEPILMNVESVFFKKAAKALKKTFGRAPIYTLSGGSIPVTATFKSILGVDSILMGYGLPDDGLHSPNEKMSIEMIIKGIKTNIVFLESFK